MSVNGGSFRFPVCLDLHSCFFIGVVLMITGNVFYLSGFYMAGSRGLSVFNLLICCLVGSMGLLVLVPSLLGVALG